MALEAAAGIVSEHDFDPTSSWRGKGGGAWWNVTNDPVDPTPGGSPLAVFGRHRALNRLALRTNLAVTTTNSPAPAGVGAVPGYRTFLHQNAWDGHGGVEYGTVTTNTTAAGCTARCTADNECSCVVHCEGTPGCKEGMCWLRKACVPARFETDAATKPFTTYYKLSQPAPPAPPPDTAHGALAYLKHDAAGPDGDAAVLVFNPGPAQQLTVDLSALPRSVLAAGIRPYDLVSNASAAAPLTSKWTVEMGAGEFKFFGGFGLGVFAPRKGKRGLCTSGYSRPSNSTTLQRCFFDCADDPQCANVYIAETSVPYTTAPPVRCTLLGAIDSGAQCPPGGGTLIERLSGSRPCAHRHPSRTARAPGASSAEQPLSLGCPRN